MSRDRISVALITDHSLTNRAIARCVDQSHIVLHPLSSDHPHLAAKLIELNPAVIFVRATLKSGSGFDLCDQIREEAKLQRTRIVFLSQDESNREKAFQHRASHFLVMPISREETARIVEGIVQRRHTILFVDDSKLQHQTIVPPLVAEGYDVLEAWNGQEALGMFEENEVDLLITDLEMPVMDGFTLCRSIKSLADHAIPPVLICSSLDSDEYVSRGFESGADDYIVKPIVIAELLSRVKRMLPGARPQRPEKILVVDDSDIVRQMTMQALVAQGLQVDQAKNAEEALEMLQSGNYHLVTTDYEMPVVNGYQFCMKLRENDELADLPIVMISARESKADEVRVRSAGIQAFVTKPFKPERLLAEVERILAETRLARQRKSMRLYLSGSAADAVDRISEQTGDVDTFPRDEFRTVFFSDICGFTPLCASLRPRDIVKILNDYFDCMVEKLVKYDAVIDKFIGDAIMALFDQEGDGAHRAICAATEMIDSLPALRQKLGIDLHIRIGLNSGYVVAGDIGSQLRRDFTVIGDTVNVGQRLESLAGQDSILVSETTYNLVKDLVDVEQTDPIQLKGKNELVRGYRIKSIQPYPRVP